MTLRAAVASWAFLISFEKMSRFKKGPFGKIVAKIQGVFENGGRLGWQALLLMAPPLEIFWIRPCCESVCIRRRGEGMMWRVYFGRFNDHPLVLMRLNESSLS